MRRGTVLLVALMLVSSGCTGLTGGGGTDPTETATPTATPSGVGGGSGSSGGSSGADDGAGGGSDPGAIESVDDFEDARTVAQMTDYIDRSPFPVFRPGETFRYEGTSTLYSETDAAVPVTMDIESHGGGEWLDADIDVRITRGESELAFLQEDNTFGRVMFGAPEFTFTQSGRSYVWLYRLNSLDSLEPRMSELSVGDSWRWESSSQEDVQTGFTFEVTERRSYAGQECVVVATDRFEGEETYPFSVACHAVDIGMPLYYAQYQDDGVAMVELELVEYAR
jgi:hypothetical protein